MERQQAELRATRQAERDAAREQKKALAQSRLLEKQAYLRRRAELEKAEQLAREAERVIVKHEKPPKVALRPRKDDVKKNVTSNTLSLSLGGGIGGAAPRGSIGGKKPRQEQPVRKPVQQPVQQQPVQQPVQQKQQQQKQPVQVQVLEQVQEEEEEEMEDEMDVLSRSLFARDLGDAFLAEHPFTPTPVVNAMSEFRMSTISKEMEAEKERLRVLALQEKKADLKRKEMEARKERQEQQRRREERRLQRLQREAAEAARAAEKEKADLEELARTSEIRAAELKRYNLRIRRTRRRWKAVLGYALKQAKAALFKRRNPGTVTRFAGSLMGEGISEEDMWMYEEPDEGGYIYDSADRFTRFTSRQAAAFLRDTNQQLQRGGSRGTIGSTWDAEQDEESPFELINVPGITQYDSSGDEKDSELRHIELNGDARQRMAARIARVKLKTTR
jgi:hypothetical protein